MKTLHIEYYAALREARGQGAETLATAADTPAALYATLRETHGFGLRQDQLRVVVNEQFAAWDSPLNGGDTIVFIPPVAGG